MDGAGRAPGAQRRHADGCAPWRARADQGRRMPEGRESARNGVGLPEPSCVPRLTSCRKAWSESIPRKRFDGMLRPAVCGVNGVPRGECGAGARAEAPPLGSVPCEPALRRPGLAAASLLTGMTVDHPGDPGPLPAHPRGSPRRRNGRSRRRPPAATPQLFERAESFRTAGISLRIDSATRFAAVSSAPLTAP